METPYTSLPAELRPAILSSGGAPLHLVDNETQKVYVLMEEEGLSPVDDDYIRKLLAEADEDIARGDVADWDLDEIKAEARRMFEERQARREQ